MELFHQLVGRSSDTIAWWQMSIRAVFIFVYLLLLVRLGGRRAFAKFTSFDIVLAVLLGSVLSRCLTANAPLVATFCASAVLVALHALLARLAVRFDPVGLLVKGRRIQLVRDGALLTEPMHRTSVTERDLMEALRSTAKTDDLHRIKAAYLERNGTISFVEG